MTKSTHPNPSTNSFALLEGNSKYIQPSRRKNNSSSRNEKRKYYNKKNGGTYLPPNKRNKSSDKNYDVNVDGPKPQIVREDLVKKRATWVQREFQNNENVKHKEKTPKQKSRKENVVEYHNNGILMNGWSTNHKHYQQLSDTNYSKTKEYHEQIKQNPSLVKNKRPPSSLKFQFEEAERIRKEEKWLYTGEFSESDSYDNELCSNEYYESSEYGSSESEYEY